MIRTLPRAAEFAIVIPVFNDWEALAHLIPEIDRVGCPPGARYRILIVNDGSSALPPPGLLQQRFVHVSRIEILHLACNIGHQRAIAVGLVSAAAESDLAGVIVMDGDGEDRPSDLPRLVEAAERAPNHIVCAMRARRSEALVFRAFYRLYRRVFRTFTGCSIDFGNFCLIPKAHLDALVRNSGIWNHLAGSIVRSRMSRTEIPTTRGRRFDGSSSMNFVSLVIHGLSAVALFTDVALIRLIMITAVLGASTLAGVALVVGIRFFTRLAIPGWATNAVGLLLVILLQAIVLFVISTFTLLNGRTAKAFMPITDALPYVARREVIARVSSVAEVC
jgi:polyisoprenyl-phosphate glycosyltransferase